MMLELDDDPLFSEWSRAPQATPTPTGVGTGTGTPAGPAQASSPTSSLIYPSLAPYELGFDDDEPVVHVSPERRERLQRYVKATVAGCLVLCVAAAVRTGVSRAEAEAELHAPTTLVAAARATPPDPPPPPVPEAVATAPAAPPPVAEAVAAPELPGLAAPPAAAPSPAAPAAPSSAAPVAPLSAPPVASSAPVKQAASAVAPAMPAVAGSAPRSAAQERELARRSLERGKLKDAVAAADRATAADPSDAEAWLILGAAQQELGHAAAARAAFTTCITSAKHGPVRECAAMLR